MPCIPVKPASLMIWLLDFSGELVGSEVELDGCLDDISVRREVVRGKGWC